MLIPLYGATANRKHFSKSMLTNLQKGYFGHMGDANLKRVFGHMNLA